MPSMRFVYASLPLFKAAIGPTSACMVLKNGFERLSTLKKWREDGYSIYCFC